MPAPPASCLSSLKISCHLPASRFSPIGIERALPSSPHLSNHKPVAGGEEHPPAGGRAGPMCLIPARQTASQPQVRKNAHPQRPGGADVPAGQYPPLPPHVSAAKDSPLFARFPLFPYWDRESTSPQPRLPNRKPAAGGKTPPHESPARVDVPTGQTRPAPPPGPG